MDRETEASPLGDGVVLTAAEERAVPVEVRRPSREALRATYDTAIRDIESKRGTQQFENGFHKQIADAVFEGCFSALEHFAEWTEQRGEPQKASHRELREVRQGTATNTVPPRLNVVTAPMGTGKTTFTTAFIIAVVRLSEADPHSPYGCLFLSDQIVKADAMFRELETFLPNQVAIWTTDHDVDCQEPTRVLHPAARFSKSDLQDHPVAIATHAFLRTDSAEKARVAVRHGQRVYRALTVVDEQMDDVIVHDASLEDVAAAQKWAQLQQHSDVVPHLHQLVQFMAPKSVTGAKIEKPKDDKASWAISRELGWFATEEAAYYAKRNSEATPKLDAVFGFAKAMVRDYAFIASGPQGPSFVGYEPRHAVVPGMVLLDATADLDGITRLCPWRSHVDVPGGDFRNLDIVHVPPLTTDPLVAFLSRNRNRQRYIDWMKSVILDNVAPGQQALVVCKKKLIGKPLKPGQATVPDWPEGDERLNDPSQYQERFGWELDGRQVSLTYWGGPGVGSNVWRNAEVVLLFDEFFLPRCCLTLIVARQFRVRMDPRAPSIALCVP
jgi:hypothetical protein